MASTAARSRARSSRREPAATCPLMQIELAEHHARTKLCTKLSILAFAGLWASSYRQTLYSWRQPTTFYVGRNRVPVLARALFARIVRTPIFSRAAAPRARGGRTSQASDAWAR